MPDPKQAFALMSLAAAMLALAAGIPALLIYRQIRRESLFPLTANWAISFNGLAILGAFVVIFLVPVVVQVLLSEGSFFEMLYGPDFPQAMSPYDSREPSVKQAAHLRGLWSQTFALPFQIGLIVAGLHFGLKASPAQIGLSRQRSGPNFVLGYLGWLVLTPLAFGVFMLAIHLFVPNPQKHPLMDLGPLAGLREWIAFALQAAILMPILEEIFFRGLLLPWLLQAPKPEHGSAELTLHPRHRAHVCGAIALVWCLQSPILMERMQAGDWNDVLEILASFFFVLLLVPVYLFLPFHVGIRRWTRLDTPHEVRALLANAMLFAAVHANVWPSPIPLFLLALGLGWLAMRTRSIVPSIIVHGLFNSVAVVYLALGGG